LLKELRKEFSIFPIESLNDDRPVINKEIETLLYTFQGTKVNRSLHFLLNKLGVKCLYRENESTFEISVDSEQLQYVFEESQSILSDIDFHLENALIENPMIIDFSKWGRFLPIGFQIKILKEKYFDFDGLGAFLRNLRIAICEEE
jgi:ATP-dependent Lhr-like helicase